MKQTRPGLRQSWFPIKQTALLISRPPEILVSIKQTVKGAGIKGVIPNSSDVCVTTKRPGRARPRVRTDRCPLCVRISKRSFAKVDHVASTIALRGAV